MGKFTLLKLEKVGENKNSDGYLCLDTAKNQTFPASFLKIIITFSVH